VNLALLALFAALDEPQPVCQRANKREDPVAPEPHFDYGAEVMKLDDVIEVDDMVRGCPMKVPDFLQTLDKHLELFEVPA
jgi:coenzyme F420-reducing hydrogenase gamma subunit